VRYEVTREVEGQAVQEGLTCPAVVLDGDRVLVEGPAEATLQSRPLFPRLSSLPGAAAPRPSSGEPLEPVGLSCGGRAVLAGEAVRADGRVVMRQGARGGPAVAASADSVTLFLDADSKDAGRGPGLMLAVLSGHATVKSPDIDAASDVIKVNRVTSHMTLLNERPEKVVVILRREVFGSDVRNDASRIDIDFTDPANPRVLAFGHEIEVDVPETQRSGR
jgi:hypothetical protein